MRMHPECLRNKELTGVPTTVPMGMLNDEWSLKNHKQTLKRLNQRGGLGIVEMLDNIHKRKLSFRKETQADVDELNALIKNYCT